jgi:hypothetical protein
MSNGKRAEYTAALERFKRMSLPEQRKYLTERLGFDPESVFTPAAQIKTHGLHFPDWICAYLADCASRMAAPGATRGDLRKALPKIMMFNMKPGANLLNPDRHYNVDDGLLAMRFAIEHVALGSTTEDALSNAYLGLNPALTSMDSWSLLAHIKKVFGIKRTPRTRAEWAAAIEPWFVHTYIAFLALAYSEEPNLRQ